MKRPKRSRETEPVHIVHKDKDKDLRIPNTTPERVARAWTQGGAKPRPETKRNPASELSK